MLYGKSPAAQVFFRITKAGFRVTWYRLYQKSRDGVCFLYPNRFHSRGLKSDTDEHTVTLLIQNWYFWEACELPMWQTIQPWNSCAFLYYSCLGTSACHVTSKRRQKSLWVARDQPALHLAREHVRYTSITRSGPFLKTVNSKNKHLKWDGLPVQRSQLLKANYR